MSRAEDWLKDHYLIEKRAHASAARGRAAAARAAVLVPTPLGELLDALPVSLDHGRLLCFGALCGLLDEVRAWTI